jgi:hypothetical protein
MANYSRVSILSGSFVLGLSACYTVEFDESKDDAYYCQSDDECLATQACQQFRCVDNSGPQIVITGPEAQPPSVFPPNHPTLDVTLSVTDFMLDEGNGVAEGSGKVQLTIDPHKDPLITTLIDTQSGQISLGAGLQPGPHRLVAQAVFGDGTAYTNPGARDHTVFFTAENNMRPQIAILEPGPGHIHVAGEPLEVRIINIGFDFVDNAKDCRVVDGCDPFDPLATCEFVEGAPPECTQISMTGHAHMYLLDDYPACLSAEPVGCNNSYIATVRPEGGPGGNEVTTVIPGDAFLEPGEFTLSTAMQYSLHDPYPNKDFIVFDQIPITIVER